MNKVVVALLAAVLLAVGAGDYLIYTKVVKPNYLSQFDVQEAQMAKDLEGTTVGLSYGQGWPFDPSQGIGVKVLGKKQVDEIVVVAVEITASATVQQEEKKDETPKPSSPPQKEQPKGEQPKLPDRVALSGVAKLHYERLGDKWFLITAEGVSLKVRPD